MKTIGGGLMGITHRTPSCSRDLVTGSGVDHVGQHAKGGHVMQRLQTAWSHANRETRW